MVEQHDGNRLLRLRNLLASGLTGDEKPFESLGYRQALEHIRGKCALDEAVESTIIGTRQYAKRQRTWFKKEPDVQWISGFGDDPTTFQTTRELVETFLTASPPDR